ncbi:MAG: DUF2779 domain-containing protein [Saprospiraceae bacterium]
MLSKSSFLPFLQCPAYFWFQHHKPEVLKSTVLTDFEQMLADQGKIVEEEVYKRFAEIVRVKAKGINAVVETKTLIEQDHHWIGQAGFMTDDFFAQADIVHIKEDGRIDIYEIKSSSSMQNMGSDDAPEVPSKEKHITDLAFQYIVATQAGYKVETTWLVELNKEYRLQGKLDHQTLFVIADVTELVIKCAKELYPKLAESLAALIDTEQPTTCNCKYLPRKKQCPAFHYLHPELMEYTVHDLYRIGNSPKRLRKFIDDGIHLIRDIPAGYDLTESYRDQVHTWNTGDVIVKRNEIEKALSGLTYPLYFLDYETSGTAIPQYDDTKPYMHVPFQYSLHIMNERNGEINHAEYLHTDRENPMHPLSKRLREHIHDIGTIIVWNKSFESKCNQNMATVVRDHALFLNGLNLRLYDLMEIFAKRYYVHKDFKGSCSIKKVLPVLVPHLKYEGLAITDGGTATTQWKRMVFEMEDDNEKKIVRQQLLECCKLDTLAMVEIFRTLVKIIKAKAKEC